MKLITKMPLTLLNVSALMTGVKNFAVKLLKRSNNLILVLITFYLLFVQRYMTGSLEIILITAYRTVEQSGIKTVPYQQCVLFLIVVNILTSFGFFNIDIHVM